jgi:hypothetical protein
VPRRPGRIRVIAGVNGAGKSTVIGATIREAGGAYFNPDEETRALLEDQPTLTLAEANILAWQLGKRGLEQAIQHDADFTFETTLGGQTITRLLEQALDKGLEVVMRYVGLDSAERDTDSREHLIMLLPRLTDLIVYDNSVERNPEQVEAPKPTILLQLKKGRIQFVPPMEKIPAWARPIVAAAIECDVRSG